MGFLPFILYIERESEREKKGSEGKNAHYQRTILMGKVNRFVFYIIYEVLFSDILHYY